MRININELKITYGRLVNVEFDSSTAKSDIDYFGFYIPEDNGYILWKFDRTTGNFNRLPGIITKSSPKWNEIYKYID